MANRVVQLLDGSKLNKKRVIKSRWVLTWKYDKNNKSAKARLVLLGYQDPDLGTYRSDAPTLTRSSKYLLLATAAIKEWDVFTLDAHTAFLLGDSMSRSEPLHAVPPPDLAKELGIPPWFVFLLTKSAFGLSEAPRAWWLRLSRELKEVGFEPFGMGQYLVMLFVVAD